MPQSTGDDFVTKLKAHGNNDFCDLAKAHEEYNVLLSKFTSTEKPSFSLNILCTLCRNLEKVPSWRTKINRKDLLKLCIDCVRQTRGITGQKQVMVLAAIYHIHKFIVKEDTSVPAELILKLSIMPFECDTQYLLKDYHKTYWSILADRINYIERLKPTQIPIIKLLPKLNEDLSKVAKIYTDQYEFCVNLLPFIIKKLTFIYVEVSSLNETYRMIFESIKAYEEQFKTLNEKQINDLYVKFSDCIYVVTENSARRNFKDSPLDEIVRVCLNLLGHRSDVFHCLQTFYLNSFLYIFNRHTDAENVFKNLLVSCEATEKLGYKVLMELTYPYLNQLLRLCIEYYQRRQNLQYLQENCSKLILFLMGRAKCKQLIKCENCSIQTGLHDALRLSFLVKYLSPLNTDILKSIIDRQYKILYNLRSLGCVNYEKHYTKLQTDIHNMAIQFYKSKNNDESINLFNIYVKNELKNQSVGKNICRALYNKSICHLEKRSYDVALRDAFLCMAFDKNENIEKYMSLVLDIKGKAVQNEVDGHQALQLMSVLDACDSMVRGFYGNLEPVLKDIRFSELLKQEFSIYERLWPSLVPMTGVIRSLNNMIQRKPDWILAEDKTTLKHLLYDIVLKTPTLVRAIHETNFKQTVNDLLEDMECQKLSLDDRMVQVALLMLKSEFKLQEATDKHGWKPAEYMSNPNQSTIYRTMSTEYDVMKDAIRAVDLLSTLKKLDQLSPNRLSHFLQLCQIIQFQLLHMERTLHGLQLAHICRKMAGIASDKVAYIRSSGLLLSHAVSKCGEMQEIARDGVTLYSELMKNGQDLEAALIFLCELGMYYVKCNKQSTAAQILMTAERCLADEGRNYSDTQLHLALGKIMELGLLLNANGLSHLSAVNIIQRHYIAGQAIGASWIHRRRYNLQLKYYIQQSSVRCTDVCSRLKLWRRATSAAGAALSPTTAGAHGRMFAHLCDTSRTDDARIKIQDRLKYILGLTHELKHRDVGKSIKTPAKTRSYQNIEVSLNVNLRSISPTFEVTIPAFDSPPFLEHTQCSCYACNMPACIILACTVASLESSLHFRSKQNHIARDYFTGALDTFKLAEAKIQTLFKRNETLENVIVDIVKKIYTDELKTIEIGFLIEYAFFELAEGNNDKANELIVKIHEVSERNADPYIRNEISNLLIATYWLCKPINAKTCKDLEIEFDRLKITTSEVPKTPETKIMPKIVKQLVKNEEIPERRKPVMKLDFQIDMAEEETPQKAIKTNFKIPVPVIPSKPNVETITPRPSRSRPKITVAEPDTPQEFFTPNSTPSEKFFTPIPKTYSRKIVKNLEAELSTPTPLESTNPRSLRKKALLRATSPGKLEKTSDAAVTRSSRRLKQPDFDK